MKRLALVMLAALATNAAAHGRDPFVYLIHFRPGAEQEALLGMTIGLVTTEDGGATWRWTCEEAVHYKDPFDPDYAFSAGGSVVTQTFIGLGVEHNTCSFAPTSLGSTYMSIVAASTDGSVYAAAADPSDAAIYKSTDNGLTFASVATPGQINDWWASIEVAPSDPQRVYLTGYRPGTPKTYLMFVSTNGGTSFSAMSQTGITTTSSSIIEIAGIGPVADTVYVHVRYETELGGDAIYKSINAGTSWTKIFSVNDPYGLTFLARRNGELVAATRTSGAWRSTDGGTTWVPLESPPHISELAETSGGEVWAGTQHFSISPPFLPPIPSDGAAVMKSTDLVTWTPVLRLQDLGPAACATGTAVREECFAIDRGIGTAWCCLVSSLAITSTEIDCTGPLACGAVTPDITPDVPGDPPCEGCCGCASGSPGGAAVFLVGLALILRRRSRVSRR